MIRIDLTLEDIRIIGRREAAQWHVTLCDGLTGVTEERTWNDEELAAVAALGIAGDSTDDIVCFPTEELYRIAESVCLNLPGAVRPIP